MRSWRGLKPGWYLLAALLVYSVAITTIALRQRGELSRQEVTVAQPQTPVGGVQAGKAPVTAQGLWFPLPGASVPVNPAHLPNAPRAYRKGVSQGFDFYDGDSGIPVAYGSAVIAATAGTLARVDRAFREADEAEWLALMEEVADGADESQLDRLRGRQLWLQADDGKLLRYAHLSDIRPGLREGQRVERGRVIGYVGNSGTDEGVAGSRRGARLHFEVWEGDTYFGQGLTAEEVRIKASTLFNGP